MTSEDIADLAISDLTDEEYAKFEDALDRSMPDGQYWGNVFYPLMIECQLEGYMDDCNVCGGSGEVRNPALEWQMQWQCELCGRQGIAIIVGVRNFQIHHGPPTCTHRNRFDTGWVAVGLTP